MKNKKASIFNYKYIPTNDKVIREALRKVLEKQLKNYRKKGHKAEIFEELGVQHGSTRIDYAIINGVMCGYEIKSDKDTLDRLPVQVNDFSMVFDKITLVVGKKHLYAAMHIVPDWWGVILAKEDYKKGVVFQTIREPEQNVQQEGLSMARLLWREEALKILEERKSANGLRSKPRELIYQKLDNIFSSDIKSLKKYISRTLLSREGWRFDEQLQLNGD